MNLILVDFVIELPSAVWIYLCAAIKLRKDVVGTDLKRQKRNHLWSGRLVGSALAKEFAEAGALLFLTGRNHQTLKSLADEILLRGGKVEASK